MFFMKSIAFYDSVYSPGLLPNKDNSIIIGVYVDVCIIVAKSENFIDKHIATITKLTV